MGTEEWNMNTVNCYIMGLPGAGKTTYLAALAYSLQQREVETKLMWSEYNGNHQHLLNLENTWLRACPVDRTNISSQETQLTIELSDVNRNKYSVTFPDLSGEIFQNYYSNREMDLTNKETICKCDAILLFINPDTIIQPILISSISPKVRKHELKPKAYEPINDPTEVQIVELLQFIVHLRNKPVSLTVVISAWDVVEDTKLLPEEYLKSRLTLLWQYLYCNKNIFKTCYYGVSAQGGTLEGDAAQLEILEKYKDNQIERIKVVDNSGSVSHDISIPLWNTLHED